MASASQDTRGASCCWGRSSHDRVHCRCRASTSLSWTLSSRPSPHILGTASAQPQSGLLPYASHSLTFRAHLAQQSSQARSWFQSVPGLAQGSVGSIGGHDHGVSQMMTARAATILLVIASSTSSSSLDTLTSVRFESCGHVDGGPMAGFWGRYAQLVL